MENNKSSMLYTELSNCSDCNKEFPTKKDYAVHRIGIHHDDLFNEQDSGYCKDCQISFVNPRVLSIHRINVHHDDLYSETLTISSSCEYCGLTVDLDDLSTHTCTSVDSLLVFNPKFNCIDCNVYFTKEDELLMHRVNVHHGDLFRRPHNQSSCLSCGLQIDTKIGVTCSKCNISPPASNSANVSKRSILEGTFSCEDCNTQFATKRKLCVHRINVHHDDLYGEVTTTPCPCEWCGLDYETDDQVISHICDILDGPDVKTFNADGVPDDLRAVEVFDSLKCPCCPLQFSQKLNLQRHYLRKHITKKKFLCCFCGLLTKTLYSLVIHEAIHLNRRPYKCAECESAFVTFSALKTHFNSHDTNKTARKCLKCLKTFQSRSGFQRHLLTHNRKDVSCEEEGCDKIFYTQKEMKRHAQVHRRVAKFICEICQDRFTTWKFLKNHLLCHFRGKAHMCEFCGAVYSRALRLRAHLADKHDLLIH